MTLLHYSYSHPWMPCGDAEAGKGRLWLGTTSYQQLYTNSCVDGEATLWVPSWLPAPQAYLYKR